MPRGICLLLALTLVAACGGDAPTPFSVTALPTPAAAGSAEPHLARGPDGTIVLSWLEPHDEGTALRHSILDENGWQPARTVASGDDWFVNWADFPSVTPVTPGLWAAHWLVKRPGGTYAYDIAIALSQDAGQSWSRPVTPHSDDTRTEHGFVSLFPWQSGVGAVWLDGRNMTPDAVDPAHGHGSGGMTLRSAVIAADRTISAAQLVDELICDCCQTDVAMGPRGPVAVYRDRSGAEIRDISVTRAIDGRWQAGRPVGHDNWKIAGCPVNGPAIAADGNRVAVAWFTAAADTPRIRLAHSADGAATFAEPVEVHLGVPIGRVDVAMLDGGDAVVSWLGKGPDKTAELRVRLVPADGEPGPVHVVARTSAARRSGFPQMVRDGARLILAWTDVAETTQVLTATIDIAALR